MMLMVCPHCDEPIEKDFATLPHVTSDGRSEERRMHIECYTRLFIGGLNHLRGRCNCCGGNEPPDPEGMTKRQAALAAYAYFDLYGLR